MSTLISGASLLLPAAIAMAMRVAVLGRPPFTDDGWYASVAKLSPGMSEPLIHSPITLYPRLLSWLVTDSGTQTLLHLRVADGVFAGLAAAALSRLLGHICGSVRGCLIACLWAAAANMPIFIDGGFKNQIIAATALLCLALCCLMPRGNARPSLGRILLGGVLAAMAVLFRESFAPLALVAIAVCFVRSGGKHAAWFIIAAACTGIAGLSWVAGGPHRVMELVQAWRTTASGLANFSTIMNRPWSVVFKDSLTQAMGGASWSVPLAVAAVVGGTLRGVKRRLHLRHEGEPRCSSRRLAPWLGAGLIGALLPEMALKLVFPYHLGQLLLGAAVLGAVCLDGVSLRWRRGRWVVGSVSTACVILSSWLATENWAGVRWAWRESNRWWPVMVRRESRPELVADSFYLRLASAVERVSKPGDRVLLSGLYYTTFALTPAQPFSGIAVDASFLMCLPDGAIKTRALEQLRDSPPRIIVESKRIATDLAAIVPGFPAQYTLAEELKPGTYASYGPYDAKVWVRNAE
ncbi:MAG: hypothetical protein NTV94_09795 [Planctomycetota bacterium]|nr:hypothetical protein [Planctomycetota bacterium]